MENRQFKDEVLGDESTVKCETVFDLKDAIADILKQEEASSDVQFLTEEDVNRLDSESSFRLIVASCDTDTEDIIEPQAFQCEWCTSVFMSKELLEQHIKKEMIAITGYRCCDICFKLDCVCSQMKLLDRLHCPYSKCKRYFHSTSRYEAHIRSHSRQNIEKIEKSSAAPQALTDDIGPYKCATCFAEYPSKKSLRMHIRHEMRRETYQIVEGKKVLMKARKCRFCEKKFLVEHCRKKHERKHEENAFLECPVCSKKFNKYGTYKKHVWRHRNSNRFVCTDCGRSFADGTNLRDHKRTHLKSNPYSCPICSEKFRRNSYMLAHAREVHNLSEKISCKFCSTGFVRQKDLHSHLLSCKRSVK